MAWEGTPFKDEYERLQGKIDELTKEVGYRIDVAFTAGERVAKAEAEREALEKCMAVLRWHLSVFQRKDESMMLFALEAGEKALGRREKLVPPRMPVAPTETILKELEEDRADRFPEAAAKKGD